MQVELVMTKRSHQLGHVVGIGAGVVALLRGGAIGVAEAAKVGGDHGEVLGQQGDQLVPVVVRLGGAVQQQQRLTLAGGDVVHADAVDPRSAVLHRVPAWS